MTDDFKEKIRQRIADASLMDDEFFRICMKDFHEKEADKIYYEALKERARHFKNMK